MNAFDALWQQTRPAFTQERTFERAKRLALSALVCLGRHTLTGLITTAGGQFADWSADFRLLEDERFDPATLFRVARQAVEQHLDPRAPLVALIGRIRKDAKLYALPDPESHGRGRKPSYEDRLPTPEQLRQDDTTPWLTVSVFAAAYAFLLPAAHRTGGLLQILRSLTPKWRKDDPNKRPSTAELISLLRQQLWGLAMRTRNFYGFVEPLPLATKPQKSKNSLPSACFYARG
jgi:hypothetical protein